MKIKSQTRIETEHTKTQGNTQFQSYEIDVPAVFGSYEHNVSFPFDVNLIRGRWFNKTEFHGDSVQFLGGPDTIIGAITANVTSGDSIINVSQTVVENTEVGFHVECNGQNWGRVINIDKDNNQITIETAASGDIVATGSEYVLQTIEFVPHIFLEGTETMMVLEGGVGSSFMPANTVMEIIYNNDSGTAKTFSVILEYFY